jgi:soluble lytic murein transglycosylase
MHGHLKWLLGGGVALLSFILPPPPGPQVRFADVGSSLVTAASAAVNAADFGGLDPLTTTVVSKTTSAPTGQLSKATPLIAPLELQRFSAAAQLYRKGAFATADAMAAQIADPAERTALEWLAIKGSPGPDGARFAAFARAHPDWPDQGWFQAVQESWLYSGRAPAAEIDAAFAEKPPRTPPGVLAFARAALAEGRAADAKRAVGELWREHDLDVPTEGAVLREFGGLLTRADHKYRADRLLYAEKSQAALRAAQLAGPDEVALWRARVEAAAGPLSPRTAAVVPANLQADPGMLFAKAQDARRTNRTADAAALLAQAPRDASALIDPDKWWSERRMVAREWLDQGEYAKAYALCAEAPTASGPAEVDASFHAGWIALRFLNDAPRAAQHFDATIAAAVTPLSLARGNYWRGRAAEAMGQEKEARVFYANAAAYPIAYYGQLAAQKLGRPNPAALRAPLDVALGDDRWLPTRVAELYYQIGFDDFATPLAYAAAQTWRDEAQIAAMGAVVAARAGAPVNVVFGKLATERGYALDRVAFPTNGAPAFSALAHSADAASVMGVIRQESEFMWRAASGAGAKGLMQILPGTAQGTARRAGIPFDYQRLVADPAFNLQLGAAYLGQLIDDEGGSQEMALAAYNAGAGRVAQWVQTFGDPRSGAVDPVDWVERIPFDETRDYVERVSENIAVYRARLKEGDAEGGGKFVRQ